MPFSPTRLIRLSGSSSPRASSITPGIRCPIASKVVARDFKRVHCNPFPPIPPPLNPLFPFPKVRNWRARCDTAMGNSNTCSKGFDRITRSPRDDETRPPSEFESVPLRAAAGAASPYWS